MEESRFAPFTALIASASKSIQRLKAVQMERYGLSAAHTNCLFRLMQTEVGLTQTELTREEGVNRAQVSRVLRELKARGYVDSPAGYKSRYRLTDAGRQVAGEISEIILRINRFVSDELSQEDIDHFYRTFRVIADNLSQAVRLYGATESESIPSSIRQKE